MRIENKSPRIVLDTSVLLSALMFLGGNSDLIFQKVRRGELSLITSSFILQEFRKFIKQKLKYKNDEIDEIVKNISKIGKVVEPHHRAKIFPEKKETNRILDCAIEGKANFIISIDSKQLQPIKKHEGIWILSPAVFLRTKIYSIS
ncbi:MAG: putative toxin-antitoxin system toxin component, PIN family [Nitrospirae bacterium]|nr:putative toxin-antitoxin system toxin component, PIN family [Nitrospirota bacterium]MBI3352809.1 putative toxin-antitoxin system toxin component, PIN family [Nitrospirota bacterium]